MMRAPNVEWTLFLPHAAEVAAHRGGTWRLAVEPREGLEGFVWRVAHSGSGRASRAGTASSANFAKAQAELAATELETEASPALEQAKAERGMIQTAYDVLVMFLSKPANAAHQPGGFATTRPFGKVTGSGNWHAPT